MSLALSVACISIMLAKNFFSTHQVQMVPVDPMKGLEGFAGLASQMSDPFREIGDPVSSEEMDQIKQMRNKKVNAI